MKVPVLFFIKFSWNLQRFGQILKSTFCLFVFLLIFDDEFSRDSFGLLCTEKCLMAV